MTTDTETVKEKRYPAGRAFPENRKPQLVCDDCTIYTPHVYDGYCARHLTICGTKIWAWLFSCTHCGNQRGFGCSTERPTAIGKGEVSFEYPSHQSNYVS